MPLSRLSEAFVRLQSEVASLSRRQQSAFFVSCAEGLLPLYLSTNPINRNVELLRRAANVAWSFTKGAAPLPQATELLAELQTAMPDKLVEAPQSTFAQDVVICIDAAVRAATTTENVKPAWVQYALEPITMMTRQQETGFYDLGGGSRADAWDENALTNPRLSRAVACCTKMLSHIKSRQLLAASDAEELVEMSRDLA